MSGSTRGASGADARHLEYLDCVRGYAILLVIACHTAYAYPGLPWPVKRVVTTGWFGVQMFFVASAVTLLMSWRARRAKGIAGLRDFAVRRLFRIAPAYYLAALLYLAVAPPAHFSWAAVMHMASFTNAMDIRFLTAPRAWDVVPGGWSISVEMSFYALFPLYAAFATNLRRSLAVLAAAAAVGTAADLAALQALSGHYPAASVGRYLFYWLPNQAAVFAMGGVLFHLMPAATASPAFRRAAPWVAAAGLAAFACIPLLPTGRFLGDNPPVPQPLAAALASCAFTAALAARGGPFVNRAVAAMGRASFSAYLLHFAVIRALEGAPQTAGLGSTGTAAAAAYVAGLAGVVLATYALARCSLALVEAPGIRAGRLLIDALATPSPGREPGARRQGRGTT